MSEWALHIKSQASYLSPPQKHPPSPPEKAKKVELSSSWKLCEKSKTRKKAENVGWNLVMGEENQSILKVSWFFEFVLSWVELS